jgi:hypothetical protein
MMSMGMHQTLSQKQQLTLEQRQLLATIAFTLRLRLVSVLNDENYEPRAICPNCGRKLTPTEIVQGFTKDPNDFTTGCSGCGTRFNPQLVCSGRISSVEVPFFCDVQTLGRLEGKESLTPDQLLLRYPGIYRSAIVHYGNIAKAFEKIGIDYQFKHLIQDWESRVEPFLGLMADTVIADCASVPVAKVRALRRRLAIARHTNRKTLEAELE